MQRALRTADTRRVASLLPAATEIACALGARAALVGISHECDFPEDVRDLPVLTSSKVRPARSSAEIDRDVRSVVRDALGVYDVDIDALEHCRPDVILTQDLCDVCAVSLDDVRRAARKLSNPNVEVVSLKPMRLSGIWASIRQVGLALGLSERASALVGALEERMREVERRAKAASSRPAVLTLEWIEPAMAGGTWMPELVALAGGAPLVTKPGDHAPTLAKRDLAALDPAPDVVVVKPCGFDLARTRAELGRLRELLSDLPWPAVQGGRIYAADGNAYFNRPGPRIAESLEILAACIHPAAFPDFAEQHRTAFLRL